MQRKFQNSLLLGQTVNNMAKIALELQPCCGKRSGIGTYAYELASRLQGDQDLQFVGNVFNFLGRNDNRASLEGISMPIRTQKSMPYGVYRRIWHKTSISYSMMFPKADLSLFFDYIVPPRIDGKVITTIHDLSFVRYPETMSKRNLKRIEMDIDYSLARSEKIITVSKFSKEELVDCLGVERDKIEVVYNAPSISMHMTDLEHLFQKYNIHKPYLLYVGTIEPRKNIIGLLNAYEKLKKEQNIPHHLVLAGGIGWNTEEILKRIENSEYRRDIVLTGYISGAEKNTLYKYATAFLFLSIYEGFGIPPLEAMHFGCPVVCANTASLPEVVGDAAELVNSHDEIAIADGIFKVIYNDDYKNKLISLGYEQEKKFKWEYSANKFKKICRSVLNI